MNNLSAPVQKSRVLTLFVGPVAVTFLCLFFFYLYLARWTENFIPRLSTEIPPLVTIRESTGDSFYRDHHDMIWLKVKSGNKHTIGDSLETRSSGSILLFFVNQPENTIRIQPSSLVRLLQVDGRILIQVKKGQVISDFKNLKDVLIQTPDGAITRIQPNSTSMTGPGTEKKEDPARADDSTEESKPRPMGLHYPSENAIMIYKTILSLTFTINKTCRTPCELKLMKDEIILVQKSFEVGENPKSELKWEQNTAGKVKWTLQSDNKYENLTGQFDLVPYSDQGFKQALKSGQLIEILD